MTDTSQALERKADRSRRRLTGLMDDLQNQISPGVMLDKVLGFSTESGSDAAESITKQVRKHPLPYLLIAAGIGWLIFSEATEKSQQGTRKEGRRRKASPKRRKAATS